MMRGGARWALLGCVLSFSVNARAQYRNNGLLVEAGAETFELVPLTFAVAAGTQVAPRVWTQLQAERKVGARPSWMQPCMDRIMHNQDGIPCRNNWYQMSDAPYLQVGYQRVLGDLLVDVTESPIIRNIVLTARSGLAGSITPPFMGVLRPVAMMHNDFGIRWNMADEKWRPFLGLNAGLNVFLDPVGVSLRTANMVDTCRRQDAGQPLKPDETCIRDSGVVLPGTETRVNAEMGLYAANALPMLFSVRPEAGLEYFFAEDVSVQFHASLAGWFSPVPAIFLRPPFVNANARVGSSLVAYF